ncbi:hypothetical protein B0H66DRAFT_276606 [Apodospora peruviana]|uniref:CHY-type domain-containing protein n=1 Tax=Apodospora peruviana TaxID=516989 RepID=A0AAE0I032_9PEZI|nr:hypothetical protein B0H66DRAFT_276606 [Apodospora peruviana]
MIPIRPRGGTPPRRDRQAIREVPADRVVPKPVPEQQVRDARTYQIEQLRRRFSPKESTLQSGESSFLFSLAPSDPDFPYDLAHLECDLRVPAAYPRRPPRLIVKNSDIPKGFAINIEKGWDKLVEDRPGATLLSLTNALDKALESFLSEKKTETVKLMTFKDTRHLEQEEQQQRSPVEPSKAAVQPQKRYIPEESFSREQIAEAKARRAQEVRQLEARMSRLPSYSKSSDGVVYTLPLEPRRKALLPPGLRPVQSAQLIIPLLYPLQRLRVLLNDVESKDAEGVEELFSQKASEQKQMTLTSHLNYLASNIHLLAKQAAAAAQVSLSPQETPDEVANAAKEAENSSTLDGGVGKSHIHVIPRPAEWAQAHDGSETSDSEDYSEDDDDEYSAEEDGGAAIDAGEPSTAATSQNPERGTAISFPSVELYNVELLEVSSLSLTVKCERCKTLNEITGLRDKAEKASSCKKCATALTVKFRAELVHVYSIRAGFIDVNGCTVADMLPSIFVPTCGKCSTPFPSSPGLSSVRGETTTNVCRECHSRFTFAIPEVKFLAYSHASALPPTSGPRRRQEKLGLHAGDPLPDKGACAHYKRSFRWFRFSCCGKVFPCDRCHDEGEPHVNEWANRMICGWCSREQRYSPEMCGFCGRSVIGKGGKGYWEGGKGTRNKVLMRRGDKRKYRRVGGGEQAAQKRKDE